VQISASHRLAIFVICSLLGRSRQGANDQREACDASLAHVALYEFIEGFEFIDLREAKAILDTLPNKAAAGPSVDNTFGCPRRLDEDRKTR
jgi:hypothetical protein